MKHLEQIEEITPNWTGQENVDICFLRNLTAIADILFREGRLGTGL